VSRLHQEEMLRAFKVQAEPFRPSGIDGVFGIHIGHVAAPVDGGLAHDQGEGGFPGAFGTVQEYGATFRQTAAEAPVQGERSGGPELGGFVGGRGLPENGSLGREYRTVLRGNLAHRRGKLTRAYSPK